MVTIFDSEITSKQNKNVKYAASLLSSKGRAEQSSARFDGFKLFKEACACGVDIEYIFIDSSRREDILSHMDDLYKGWRDLLSSTVIPLSGGAFSAITEEKSPEGVICTVKYLDKFEKCGTIIRKEFFSFPNFKKKETTKGRSIAIEAIRDPGNLGTIIRTCLALGCDNIYLSRDCADVLSPKVIRSSMGAVFAANLFVSDDFCASLGELKAKGFRIDAAALYGEPQLLSEVELSEKDVFVIGNEGHGLSDEVLSIADRCVIIDMDSRPGCESLNAAVAAAICAWEQKRRCDSQL